MEWDCLESAFREASEEVPSRSKTSPPLAAGTTLCRVAPDCQTARLADAGWVGLMAKTAGRVGQ